MRLIGDLFEGGKIAVLTESEVALLEAAHAMRMEAPPNRGQAKDVDVVPAVPDETGLKSEKREEQNEGEHLLRLKELCSHLRRTPSWAFRVGIPAACGIRFGGGRPVYRLSDVLVYLDSPECKVRRAELRSNGWGRRAKTKQGKNGPEDRAAVDPEEFRR